MGVVTQNEEMNSDVQNEIKLTTTDSPLDDDIPFKNSNDIDEFLESLSQEQEETKVYQSCLLIYKFFKKQGFIGTQDDIKLLSGLLQLSSSSESLFSLTIQCIISIINAKTTNLDILPLNDIKILLSSAREAESRDIIYFGMQLASFMSKTTTFIEYIVEVLPLEKLLEELQNSQIIQYQEWCLCCLCNILYHYTSEIPSEFIERLLLILCELLKTNNETIVELSLHILINISSEEQPQQIICTSMIIDMIVPFRSSSKANITYSSIQVFQNLFNSGLALDSPAIPEIVFLLASKKDIRVQVIALQTISTFLIQCPDSLPVLEELGLFEELNQMYEQSQVQTQSEIVSLLYHIVENNPQDILPIIEQCPFVLSIPELLLSENENLTNEIIFLLIVLVDYDKSTGETYQIVQHLDQ